MLSNTPSCKLMPAFLVLSAVGLFSARGALADETRLVVDKAVWTSGVENLDHAQVYGKAAPVAPLYLWMRLKGSNWALQRLHEAGKLPLYHKWFRHSIVGVSSEGVTEAIDSIKIPAGNVQLINQLGREIDARGYFDWRTWSMKENVKRGKWVVKVMYADGAPVLCEGDKPCVYEIVVQ